MGIGEVELTDLIMAIGGLGLAAFALVDASKIGRHGGLSHSGFAAIESAVRMFVPQSQLPEKTAMNAAQPLGLSMLQILHAHWINGMALADQKAIAKSLIKLQLTPDNAEALARLTGVDAAALRVVAQRMTSGSEILEGEHANALGRFDLAVTAILDAAYQRADQRYRNSCKLWASVAAVVLALLGGLALELKDGASIMDIPLVNFGLYLFCGILAVPLAPISKDLTSALSAAVKMAQTLRR